MQSMMLLYVGIALMVVEGARQVRFPRGHSLDGVGALLYLHAALFVGWFATANELAVMVLITASVFAWCAFSRAEPEPASNALARAA
jgi:hypothetical protein